MEAGRPVTYIRADFNGPYRKGYMREIRLAKCQEAEERNAKTLPMNRRSYARSQGYSRVSAWMAATKHLEGAGIPVWWEHALPGDDPEFN
jgi:hypothetical protein